MRRERPIFLRHIIASLLLCLLMPSCASIDRSVALSELAVVPVTVGEAADISADELAEAMLRAGFSRDEVLRHGPPLHEALATSGGAQVRQERVVSAIFVVHAGKLYVTSRARGTFVLPLGMAGPAAFAEATT